MTRMRILARLILLRLLVGDFISAYLVGDGWRHVNRSFRSVSHQDVPRTRPRPPASASSLSATVRNMFHDYNGPIVLLGCSGPDNELSRLAAYLSTQVLAPSSSSAPDDAPPASSRIIPLTRGSAAARTMLDGMVNREYAWPDILLLDASFRGEDDDDDDADLVHVAHALYETHACLTIYINTDACPYDADTKKQWEETVFVKYSDYEICILDEGDADVSTPDDWYHIEWELTRILARARLAGAIPGRDDGTSSANNARVMGPHTFFLSLTFPDLALAEPYVEAMCPDVDAMEVRTDLLSCRDSRFDILYGMQLLRKFCRPHVVRVPALPSRTLVLEDVMPLVYTVRTRHQAGTFPDDENGIAQMFQRLHWGLRAGVEVLDVESAWNADATTALLHRAQERYASLILGSHHVVGQVISTDEAVDLFFQCALNGRAHGAKVVLSIDDESKDRMAYEAALIATDLAQSNGDPVIPNISLILGEVGQFSRVINLPFTPVTHESLPFVAAPGQLTASEIMTTRLLTRIFEPLKYAILGHNIAYSVSPQMQGAAFASTKLPHEYIRVDVATVEEFIESDFFKSDDFGGASVTVPHKQAIMPYVDELSDAARAIGSVNTVIAKTDYVDEDFVRVIYGDNTDWKGIYNPLSRLLGSKVDPTVDFALIIGAGGTARAAAYVAKQLNLHPLFYNRTPAKAEELATAFGGSAVSSLEQAGGSGSLGEMLGTCGKKSIRVVISTVPAASDFVLPDWLLSEAQKPIVFDVNYKPYSTKLLLQAEAAGCPVVRGSEMLWEQGVGQFELWTGRTAPYSVMKQVVLQNCQEATGVIAPTLPLTVFE